MTPERQFVRACGLMLFAGLAMLAASFLAVDRSVRLQSRMADLALTATAETASAQSMIATLDMLSKRPDAPGARMQLARLAWIGRIMLGLTVVVPFLALGALLLNDVDRAVIGMIAAISFLGCALAYPLDLLIRGDLAALASAVNPGRDALLAGDSIDSLLSGSRH